MRIVQVMLAKRFGGAERSFVDLSLALARRGHDVLAIGESRGVALAKIEAGGGVSTRAMRCYGTWDVLAAAALKRTIGAYRPDLVQAHLARAAHLAGRAAKSLGLPTLAKTHNLVKLKYYASVDLLVATTTQQREYLRGRGVGPKRLCLIPNFSAVSAASAPREVTTPPLLIRTLGRLVDKKGFDILIRAMPGVIDRGIEVQLTIAGDGPCAAKLRRLADTLGLAREVVLAGWIDDVAGFLGEADLFVLPSRDEPFGIAVLEAMALGVPIIATPTAGPSEILTPREACFVEVGDIDGLTAAIVDVVDERDAATARAQMALDKFAASYCEATVVDAYLDAYARLIGGQALNA